MHPSIEQRRDSLQAREPLRWLSELTASVIVTTHCNRICPHCCVQDMTRCEQPEDIHAAAVASDIHRLGAVQLVLLTGGEPTLHWDFVAVLRRAREARGPAPMMLFTNGANLQVYAEAIKLYCDGVRLSLYDENSRAGTPTDPEVVVRVQELFASSNCTVDIFKAIHQRVSGGRNPCSRLFNTISVQKGSVYPCCVAHGIAEAEYTELSGDWPRRLLDITAPCERCVFGVK